MSGLKLPHDLTVRRLGIWFEEVDSELLYKKRGFEMRYLARLAGKRDTCLVLLQPRHFADAMLLLTMLHRNGVKADVRIAPGETDWRLSQASRVKTLGFLGEVFPKHAISLVTEEGVHALVKEIETGTVADPKARPFDSAFLFTDIDIDFTNLTAARKAKTIFLHHRVNQRGLPKVRAYLASIVRDGYFVDGRLSNEYQVLARRRDGQSRY